MCFLVTDWSEDVAESLVRLIKYTDGSIPIFIVGSQESVRRAEDFSATLERRLFGLALEGVSVPAWFASSARASFPSDIALVRPGVRVSAGWLEGLRRAAHSDTTVASATPFSLGDAGVELSGCDHSVPLDELAAMVGEHSLGLRPRIGGMGPGCVYIRRSALELVAPQIEGDSLNDSLDALTIELMALGMLHVLADDVLVGGTVGGGYGEVEDLAEDASRSLVRSFAEDDHGALRRARNRAQLALGKLSVTIDGRSLTPTVGGTQTYIIELILALANEREVQLSVLVPPNISERATKALASITDLALITYEEAIANPGLANVVHRPQQIFTPDDLTLLRLLGERVVIGQQDLIAYHNPSYHRDPDAWHTYRRTTRLALAGADQAVFFSEHARHDALSEDLLPARRTHVVGVGADPIEPESARGIRPDGLADADFVLCLGTDYAHKNRPFAIEMFAALRVRGWPGRLVLAGPHVPYGSSLEQEQRLLAQSPELEELVIDLGPVDEATRIWLTGNARALIFPTIFEGFGLLPLEAARAGVPCAFAAQASLSEFASAAATLVPWDAQASADAVLPLLVPGDARDAHLARLQGLSVPNWSQVARELTAVYEHALSEPPSEAAPRVWQELDRENYIVRLDADVHKLKDLAQEYQDAYHSLEVRVRAGLPLIDEGGLLSPEQQRGLMRLATRGRFGAIALKPLGLLGRVRKPHSGG